MILKKTLSILKESYSKLPKLHNYRTSDCNRILKTKTVSLKNHRVLSNQLSFCFYSSTANEEKIQLSAPAITIPPLLFEDVSIEKAVSHEELCKALQACNSLEEQMHTLTSTMTLSCEDIQIRENFCKVIESILRPFFGEIKIQMYGSSANGFGFKGCDLDMSFKTFTEQKEEVSYLDFSNIPLVSEVLNGKVSPLEISMLPPKEQLSFIHTVLQEFYKESEKPTIFIEEVPLIRFYHDKYDLKCDLTCKNRVALANTKLLYLLGRLDERVIPLMMTIRYWAKHVGLSGKGLFNTYAISLMVVHFLQTLDPPILPCVQHILSLSDSLQIEDMSDKSFLSIRNLIPPSKNTQTLSELLRGFFFHYLYFDFTRVICPLIGGSVPRQVFLNESNNKEFRINTISVQDPMLVSHNVAEHVDYKVCRSFSFAKLLAPCRIFQDSSALVPSLSKLGLLALLDKSNLPNKKFPTTVSLTVPLITKQIFSECAKDNIQLSTAETLLQLLRYTLLFECNVAKPAEAVKNLKQRDAEITKRKKYVEKLNYHNLEFIENNEKHRKRTKSVEIDVNKYSDTLMVDDFQKLNLNNRLVLCAECKPTKNTWLGRSHVSLEQLPPNCKNSVIEKEKYISILAAKQNSINVIKKNSINVMDEKINPLTFLFECYTSPELPESHLLVNFRPLQNIYLFPILGVFLKEYLPNLIKNINKNS